MVRRKIGLLAIVIILIGAGLAFWLSQKDEGENEMNNKIPSSNLQLSSEAFADGAQIPSQYTCKGQNVNPQLTIANVPAGAKSLALIMHDPDAPAGDWLHWTLWNITPDTAKIDQNSTPAGAIAGTTDFGKPGYGGPCPPSGTHHYLFDLYALDKILDLQSGADRNQLEKALQGHIVGQTKLTGLFGTE